MIAEGLYGTVRFFVVFDDFGVVSDENGSSIYIIIPENRLLRCKVCIAAPEFSETFTHLIARPLPKKGSTYWGLRNTRKVPVKTRKALEARCSGTGLDWLVCWLWV